MADRLAPPSGALDTTKTYTATFKTEKGDIVVDLFADRAPRTVENFIGLADGTGEWKDPATGAAGQGPLYKDIVESKDLLKEKRFPVVFREMKESGKEYFDQKTFDEFLNWLDSLDRI